MTQMVCGDDVVQLAGDAKPFVGHGRRGDLLQRLRGEDPPLVHGSARGPRRARDAIPSSDSTGPSPEAEEPNSSAPATTYGPS